MDHACTQGYLTKIKQGKRNTITILPTISLPPYRSIQVEITILIEIKCLIIKINFNSFFNLIINAN